MSPNSTESTAPAASAPAVATETTVAAPTQPFHLASTAPLRPAVTLGLGLPSHVSGLPAFYYWKDAIVVGSYVHPSGRFSLDVTREKLDSYAATFARMKSNGVAVPILMDHANSAAATLGWIVDVKRRGDRLLELHQFLGEDARDIGLRNFVSLGIDPNFIDGRGVRYGEAIVHSAVTPTPVVPGQGGFEAADSSVDGAASGAMLTLSLATDVSESPPGLPPPAVIAEPEVAQAPPIQPPIPGAAAQAPIDSPAIDLALSALADAAAAKRDLAIAHGGIAPAVADELFALLVRSPAGALNVMTLSRGAGSPSTAAPLALAIFDALSRNQPVALGESTGLQVLARLVPGEDDERAELQERMIALASARR